MQSLDTSPRSVYRWAMQHGWTPEQAGSWAAYCNGVPIVVGEELFRVPWTPHQLNSLLFLRHLVTHGHIRPASDTPSTTTSGPCASVA